MKVSKLKSKLGPGFAVQKEGRKIAVTSGGLTYRIDNQRGRNESEAAEYLRSKIPAATIRPNV